MIQNSFQLFNDAEFMNLYIFLILFLRRALNQGSIYKHDLLKHLLTMFLYDTEISPTLPICESKQHISCNLCKTEHTMSAAADALICPLQFSQFAVDVLVRHMLCVIWRETVVCYEMLCVYVYYIIQLLTVFFFFLYL